MRGSEPGEAEGCEWRERPGHGGKEPPWREKRRGTEEDEVPLEANKRSGLVTPAQEGGVGVGRGKRVGRAARQERKQGRVQKWHQVTGRGGKLGRQRSESEQRERSL